MKSACTHSGALQPVLLSSYEKLKVSSLSDLCARSAKRTTENLYATLHWRRKPFLSIQSKHTTAEIYVQKTVSELLYRFKDSRATAHGLVRLLSKKIALMPAPVVGNTKTLHSHGFAVEKLSCYSPASHRFLSVGWEQYIVKNGMVPDRASADESSLSFSEAVSLAVDFRSMVFGAKSFIAIRLAVNELVETRFLNAHLKVTELNHIGSLFK